MAIEWQKTLDKTHYEVRSAGRTRRLYTDGVFHSQFNPGNAITGGVWDLLMLPAFFYARKDIQRILVLGVGGGAVIHQLQRYFSPEVIIGVELNPVHIMVAKRYFGISDKHAQLVEADAIKWLENYSGPPFDLIVDDLFGEQEGEPVRAVKANKVWFETLNKHLSADGLLVINFVSLNDLKNCAAISYKKIANLFCHVFQFTLSRYDNAIGAFLKKSSSTQILRKNINDVAELKKSKKLIFHVRKLK